jgi:hypothetical protein
MLRFLILLALAVPSFAQVNKTMCNGGCDYTGAQLQTAINTAATFQDGTTCTPYTIDITAGTTIPDGLYSIPNKSCAQYVTLETLSCPVAPGTRISPSNAASMAHIRAPIGTGLTVGAFSTVDNGGTSRYWAFNCLEIDVASGSTLTNFVNWIVGVGVLDSTLTAQYDHFTFSRNYIHGQFQKNGPLRGLDLADVSDVDVEDNYITEIHEKVGDSQAVYCPNCRTNIFIKNNYLAASGEVFMTGGTGQKRVGNVPTNIQLIGNQAEKPYSWAYYSQTANPANGTNHCMNLMSWFNTSTSHRWQCNGSDTWIDQGTDTSHMVYDTKGMFELKNAQNVQMVGNVFTGGWLPQANLADAQPCGVFPMNQVDVGITAEVILDVTTAFNKSDYCLEYSFIGVIGTYTTGPGRIYHHDDLATALGDGRAMPLGNPDSQNIGTANLSKGMYGNIRFENLTIARSTQAGSQVRIVGLPSDAPASIPNGPMTLTNNILPLGFYGWIDIGQGGGSGACSFLAMMATPATASLGGNIFSEEDTTTITTGAIAPGCSNSTQKWAAGTLANPLITNIIDTFYKPRMGFRNSATNGRDSGANIDLVNSMTANAVAGTPNPWLTTWITTLTPSSTGVVIQATAFDTNPVTWELSTDCAFYASPIAVSSQMRSGRSVTATWDPGTLVEGTTYCARMTTAGQPGQEWMTYGTSRASFTTSGATSSNTSIQGNATISGNATIQ